MNERGDEHTSVSKNISYVDTSWDNAERRMLSFYRKCSHVLSWFIFIYSSFCFAQDEEIKIASTLVSVPVTVLDRSGRHITKLKKEDFRVFENGMEQEISFLDTVDKPVTVLLVMDVSGSMMDKVDVLANAATVFLHNLCPYDTVGAATFNETINVLFKFAEAKEVWKRKKFKLRVDGLPPVTMIFDGMEFA